MMKHLVISLFATAAMALATTASASGTVTASHAWIRLLPGNLPAAAYVQLHNDSDKAARLTGASSAAFANIMLHQSTLSDGQQHMRMVAGMDIPAHGNAALTPGGYHLMLMQRTLKIAPGDTLTLDLKFDDGSQLQVPFVVRPANADGDGE